MILVYSNQQHGGPILDGFRIPGYLDPLEPARIPWITYWWNRGSLKFAYYTKERLERIFGGNFPKMSFRYDHLNYMSYEELVALTQALNITSAKHKQLEKRRQRVKKYFREYG